MYTIAKIYFNRFRFSIHDYKGIGMRALQITSSEMTYTYGHDVMVHIHIGHIEFRITFEH